MNGYLQAEKESTIADLEVRKEKGVFSLAQPELNQERRIGKARPLWRLMQYVEWMRPVVFGVAEGTQ